MLRILLLILILTFGLKAFPQELPESGGKSLQFSLAVTDVVVTLDEKGCKPTCIEKVRLNIKNDTPHTFLAIDSKLLLIGPLGEELNFDRVISRYDPWPAGAIKSVTINEHQLKSVVGTYFCSSEGPQAFLCQTKLPITGKLLVYSFVADEKRS